MKITLTHIYKTVFFLALVGVSFIIATSVSAAEHIITYKPIVDVPWWPSGEDTNNQLIELINTSYQILIAVGSVWAVIRIAMAGVKYSMSDIITTKGEALGDIKGALFGLFILIIPYLVLYTINPNLVDLDVLNRIKPIVKTVEVPESSYQGRVSGIITIEGEVASAPCHIDPTNTSRSNVYMTGSDQEACEDRLSCTGDIRTKGDEVYCVTVPPDLPLLECQYAWRPTTRTGCIEVCREAGGSSRDNEDAGVIECTRSNALYNQQNPSVAAPVTSWGVTELNDIEEAREICLSMGYGGAETDDISYYCSE